MTVYELDGRLLVVDCGVLFPEDAQPGVDLILPDLRLVEDRVDDIDAVVVTHGHEDHIGALPWLLRLRRDIPVIGARFSPGADRGQVPGAPAHPGPAGGRRGRSAAGSAASTWSSSRSTTPSRTRWRWPSAPRPAPCCTPATSSSTSCRWTAGSPTSAASPGSVTRASTCSWWTRPTPRCPGSSRSEREIGPVLDTYIRSAPQRVIVASFASHVHRVQQMLDSAARYGRKVAFVGRSMVRNMQIAQELGLLVGAGRVGPEPGQGAGPAAGAGAADLDRLPGRAAVGAVPDVARRAPRRPARSRATR